MHPPFDLVFFHDPHSRAAMLRAAALVLPFGPDAVQRDRRNLPGPCGATGWTPISSTPAFRVRPSNELPTLELQLLPV
jgi:hypothetical protein